MELKGINKLNPETFEVVSHPPVSEIEIDSLTPAAVVWGRLLEEHPEILSVDIVHYPSQAHGFSNRYWIDTYPSVRAEEYLGRGLVPSASEPVQDCYAIGSLVGVTEGRDPHETRWGFKASWMGDTWEMPKAFKAFVALDLETRATEKTLETILYPLSYIRSHWYLLQTDASYHLVLDELVDPAKLPSVWAGFVDLLTPVSRWNESLGYLNCLRRRDVGDAIRQRSGDVAALRRFAQELLPELGHVDDSDKTKLTSLIDLRWLMHSLEELCDHLDGKRGNAGFLRLSGSKKHRRPPLLIAEKDSFGLKVFRPRSNIFMSEQTEFNLDCDTCVL